MERALGTIVRLVSIRGFGFIAADGGGDLFFQMSGCRAFTSLREGDRVSFVPEHSAKGPRATDVSVAG